MYLLDADTLIFFLKGHEKVTANFRACLGQPKAISIVSYGELLYGAHKSARPRKTSPRCIA